MKNFNTDLATYPRCAVMSEKSVTTCQVCSFVANVSGLIEFRHWEKWPKYQ